jgi:hypothetical protein
MDVEKDKPSMHRYYTRLQAKNQAKMRSLLVTQQVPPQETQKMRDINVIKEILAKCGEAKGKAARTEICIEIFDYLCAHPFLMQTERTLRSTISQKMIELEKIIWEERQSLKMGPSNRSIAEWRKTAQLLGLFDILEEIFRRVKLLL